MSGLSGKFVSAENERRGKLLSMACLGFSNLIEIIGMAVNIIG